MKSILSAGALIALAACSAQIPTASPSAVSGNYREAADQNRQNASLTVETVEPVTLLEDASTASTAELDCIASFTMADWLQNSHASVQNGDGATIAQYVALHMLPNEVKVDGDRIAPLESGQPFARAYTDDGHQGSICAFEFSKLRVAAAQ